MKNKIKNKQDFENAVNAFLSHIGAQKEAAPIVVDYINTSTGREYSVYQPIGYKKIKEQDFVEARKHGLILQHMSIRIDIEKEDLPLFDYCLVNGELQPIVKSDELIEKIKHEWGHNSNAVLVGLTINPKVNMITAEVNIGEHSKMYYLLCVREQEKYVYSTNNLEIHMKDVKQLSDKANDGR